MPERGGTSILSVGFISVFLAIVGQSIYIGRWTKGIEDAQEAASKSELALRGDLAQARTDIGGLEKRQDAAERETRLLRDEIERFSQTGAYAPLPRRQKRQEGN